MVSAAEPMAGISNTMGTKPFPSKAHNLTGLYLGSENVLFSPKSSPVPLHRNRARTVNSRTTTEERRHQMVELLREKEEKLITYKKVRKGFSGKSLKNKIIKSDSESLPDVLYRKGYGTQTPPMNIDILPIWDLTKKTSRNFTSSLNSGVSHYEYLCPTETDSISEIVKDSIINMNEPIKNTVVQEVDRIAASKNIEGLSDSYYRICKGNINSLNCLISSRNPLSTTQIPSRFTGLTVRGYHNPGQAEILSNFTLNFQRSKTDPHLFRTNKQLNPYFLNILQNSNAKYDEINKTDKKRNVTSDKKSTSLAWQPRPQRPHTKLSILSTHSGVSRGHPGTPVPSKLSTSGIGFKKINIDIPAMTSQNDSVKPDKNANVKQTEDIILSPTHVKCSSIAIGLETDDGDAERINIDEEGNVKEGNSNITEDDDKRRKSIAEKLSESRLIEEQLAKKAKERAELREQEVNQLLSEHAQLVEVSKKTTTE